MPKYEYEAVSLGNKQSHKGIVEAASMEAAIQHLISKHIFPSTIAELSTAQVEVANRIANLKKFARPKEVAAQKVTPALPPMSLLIPPKKKHKFDWTYIIIVAVVVAVLTVWAFSIR
jgi:type II secretory pathway component PulF